jgi:hypothetical protein
MTEILTHAVTSRRAFLRLAAIAGGASLLAACQQAPAPAPKPTEAGCPGRHHCACCPGCRRAHSCPGREACRSCEAYRAGCCYEEGWHVHLCRGR